jgi:two-component system, sporulation sensor kinase E
MNHYSEKLTDLYQMLVENTNNLIIVLDRAAVVRAINKAFRIFLNISDELETIGRKCSDILDGPLNSILRQALESDQELNGLECWVNVKGKSHYIIIDTKIIKDINGSTTHGIMCIIRNVTERKLEEQKLLTLEKQAVIGKLAAGIAHEIRNPLTAAFGFLQLMLQGSLEEQPRKHLEYVLYELKSISKLVTDFMFIAKPTETNVRVISIRSLLNETIDFMQAQATLSNIVIVRNIMPNEAMIMADAEQIKHVFINLIRNAIEATNKDHAQIIISIEVLQRFVKISIEDEGIGIVPENITKIFDPFFTTKDEGTGIGLTGVYQIIQNHKGDISVESKEGEGTKFIVSLPNE